MKSFFIKSDINDFGYDLKYNQKSFDEFLNSNYKITFNVEEIFYIILKYKHDILIDELTIRKYIFSLMNDKRYEIVNIKILEPDSYDFSSIEKDVLNNYVLNYLYFNFNKQLIRVLIKHPNETATF